MNGDVKVESRLSNTPLSHLMPPLRAIPCEYVDEPYIGRNYRLNGLQLCCRQYMPTSTVLGVLSCQYWQISRKSPKKTRFLGLRSSLAPIERAMRLSYYAVVNSNLSRISHDFGVTATYWSKRRLSVLLLYRLTPLLGWFLANTFYRQKLESVGYRQRRRRYPMFICFDTIPACDGRTGRQTNERTEMLQLRALSIA